MTVTYCTPDEVSSFLGLGVNYFTALSKPSLTEVENIINQVEEYIDRMTHHAWREKVANDGAYEYHQLGRLGTRSTWFTWLGYPIYLKYRRLKKFDASKGDRFEVYNGNVWEDWLATKTEGMNGDFWVDYDNGIVFVFGFWRYIGLKEYMTRFKYRYGEATVPLDIKRACVLLVASQLVAVNDKLFMIPEGGTGVLNIREKIELWREEADRILSARREFAFGGE
ncbi:MAG: hypothetical protein ACUVUF_07840 [Candidatus Bathycorpusculaceae bacterium]